MGRMTRIAAAVTIAAVPGIKKDAPSMETTKSQKERQ